MAGGAVLLGARCLRERVLTSAFRRTRSHSVGHSPKRIGRLGYRATNQLATVDEYARPVGETGVDDEIGSLNRLLARPVQLLAWEVLGAVATLVIGKRVQQVREHSAAQFVDVRDALGGSYRSILRGSGPVLMSAP